MKKLFLLGGHDLEMLEITEILKSQTQQYKDKELRWGAKLSDYKEFLDFEGTIYGIELEEDIAVPENYIAIDHHGKNDAKQSSLEQVAELLNIKLSRTQQLIAANDSRYIDGMKSLCASQEEIDEIRRRDIEAQRIDPLEIKKAKDSFENAKKENNNFIFSKSQFFSPLSDLAYYEFGNYVIYDDSKVIFYRYQKKEILDFFAAQNIDEKNYYYGGGDFGFIGIKEGIFNKEKIENLLEEFKIMKNKEELYSYHTFMLPFTFEGHFIENKNWDYKPFKAEKQRDYNEFIYFYKHIQDAIYNKEKENSEKWISQYFEYKETSGTYVINCKKGEFELELDGISLRIFNTNVAILAFNLKNTKYHKPDDVLAINDFGRRIYPQFLGDKFTVDTKNAILANCITLNFENNEPIIENFNRFDTQDGIQKPNLLPKFISELIEENFSKDKDDKTTIRPIIDDRMFVISWYGNKTFSESLKYEQYISNSKWYEYVFVDGDGIAVHSKKMQTDLITNSTYDRWMDNPYGCTLYGISRYSFVAATNESDFAKGVILPHMQTMYFQMFTLLLAYRATIIKFADEIQDATSSDETITIESQKVYKKYLSFLNKLYFKEVTAQDQGIELYNQAMKIMDIEKYMKDLDEEINELHGYVGMLEEEKRTASMNKISKMGSYLLLPALVTGIFGMNIIDFEKIPEPCTWCYDIVSIAIIVGSGFFMPWILNKYAK